MVKAASPTFRKSHAAVHCLLAVALHLLPLLSGRRCLLPTTDAFVVPTSTTTTSGRVVIPISRPARPALWSSASVRPRLFSVDAETAAASKTTLASSSTADEEEGTDSSKSSNSGPLSWIRESTPVDGKNRLSMGLAFLTGWADVALVFRYKDFATMHTGSAFKLAWATIDSRLSDVLYYTSVMLCYMVGLAAFRRAELSLKEKSLSKFCAPVVTVMFCLADYLSFLNPARKWPSMTLLSVCYGIINSVGTEMAGSLCFVLTGHMTRLTNVLVDRFSETAGHKRIVGASASGALRSASIIVAFLCGALWACQMFQLWPKLLERGGFAILGTIYGLLFLWQDRDTLGGWWKRKDKRMLQAGKYEAFSE